MMLMMMENGSKEERKKLENHMEIKLCDSTFDEKENEKKTRTKSYRQSSLMDAEYFFFRCWYLIWLES